MQRAAASNAAKEPSRSTSTEESQDPSPKRPKTSTGHQYPSPSAVGASDLEAISTAIAAEEAKRREAVARQAAEAGESEWVLDFSDASAGTAGTYATQPFVVAAGSLDDGDYLSNGGRQTYGNFKRKKNVCLSFLFNSGSASFA